MEPDITEPIYSEPMVCALRPGRKLLETDNTTYKQETNGMSSRSHMSQNLDASNGISISRAGGDGRSLFSNSESVEQPRAKYSSHPLNPRPPKRPLTSQEGQASLSQSLRDQNHVRGPVQQGRLDSRNVLENGSLGSANEYEEVLPLVDHQAERNRAYNAFHTSSLDNNYVIPNQTQTTHNRRPSPQVRDQGGGHGNNDDYISIVDSRNNERFTINMKRYIFTCLGMPGIPGMSSRINKFCRFGVLAYICLFIWGIVCICLSVIALTKEIQTVFVATILCGSVFIFLGFYWLTVFRWIRISEVQTTTITFSFLYTFWMVLCLFFIGSMTSLIVELYHNQCYITCLFNKDCTLNLVYEHVPFLSISSILIVWLVYVFIFALNFIYACSR